MTTAKENIMAAPDKCFVPIEVGFEIGMVLAGEEGYYKQATGYHIECARNLYGFDPAKEWDTAPGPRKMELLTEVVDLLNKQVFDVSPEQMEAAKWGSMFGWESPAAHPDYWKRRDEELEENA